MASTAAAMILSALSIVFAVSDAAPGWTLLAALDAWRGGAGDWFEASQASPDPANPKLLSAKPGRGLLVNGKSGKTAAGSGHAFRGTGRHPPFAGSCR